MHIITLTTQKGGAGKTTLATALAVAAQEAGETAVMLDLDPQRSLLTWAETRTGDAPHVEAFPADKIAQLPTMVRRLASSFSVAILDTAGADNTATHKAMEAATLCVVPLRPTRLDVNAVRPTVQAILRGGTPFAFVLNQCPPQPNNSRAAEMAAGLAAIGSLAEPIIIQRADYQDAYAVGQGVTEYAPNGKAADEARRLWRWVAKQSKGTAS
ncbi:AAA family ATPase [Aurantimonas sp. VKM B-3413]|uniref:AAA family ATPase n=1 Tax=Aurantimonas sp. VKM B-3413 TaxID=2779401 RepID=UPI001E47D4AE|nr:AAA family ATPase [Aurantimonas sp. VKM B-3413]MCB8835817.1 AAA family ATPase [Aurantimonas sp. VKM B-3413]